MSKNKIDLTKELLIYRFGQGIKLIPPEFVERYKNYHLAYNTGLTIDNILHLPLNLYFLNTEGSTELINNEGALLCGFGSGEKAYGKSLFDVSHYQSASSLINNCKKVLTTQTIQFFDEVNIRKDTAILPFLSVKSPWFDEKNKLIGIFGCSICLDKHPLANSLTLLKQLGLLNHAPKVSSLKNLQVSLPDDIYFSKRELDCLHLLIKGYTAKRMGQHLGISHRTVEDYLTRVKIKFGVQSKSQLIEMAIDYFVEKSA